MKLYWILISCIPTFLYASQESYNPLEMRSEVLGRTKYGKLFCSVIHDTVTNSYIGILVNDNYYVGCPWVYRQLSNEESKSYFYSFYSLKGGSRRGSR